MEEACLRIEEKNKKTDWFFYFCLFLTRGRGQMLRVGDPNFCPREGVVKNGPGRGTKIIFQGGGRGGACHEKWFKNCKRDPQKYDVKIILKKQEYFSKIRSFLIKNSKKFQLWTRSGRG